MAVGSVLVQVQVTLRVAVTSLAKGAEMTVHSSEHRAMR